MYGLDIAESSLLRLFRALNVWLWHVASVKSLLEHWLSAFSGPLGLLASEIVSETRVPLNTGQWGVKDVACCSIAHE